MAVGNGTRQLYEKDTACSQAAKMTNEYVVKVADQYYEVEIEDIRPDVRVDGQEFKSAQKMAPSLQFKTKR
jgi:hypothetical protein